MFEFSLSALTLFAVMMSGTQNLASSLLKGGLTVLCLMAVIVAIHGEFKRR